MDNFSFKKIDPISSSKETENSGSNKDKAAGSSLKQKMKLFSFKKLGLVGIILIILAIFAGYTGVRVLAIVKSTKDAQKQAKAAFAAIKNQNAFLAKEELIKTQKKLVTLKKDVDAISYLNFIPLVGSYSSDGQHLVNAASYGVDAAIIATDSVIPYADVLGLKGQKSFVMGSAEDRIRLAVKTMGKVVPKIDDIEQKLSAAKIEVDKVSTKRYPNFWIFKKMRDQVQQVKNITDQSVLAVEQGKPLIKTLPKLLGDGGEKKYLVLFQNDSERRPTGGFLTFYAVFRVEDGIIKVDNASDIYDLDDSIWAHPPAPRIIANYLPDVPKFNIRDTNLSPDFVESMKTFNELYDKARAKQKVDGVIAIDTKVLVHILDILGEVQTAGLSFNTKNDTRCNCPQVVYVLEDNTSRPVNHFRSNRKGIVGDLLFAIMNKALRSSPKLYWGKLFQQGVTDIAEKHVLFDLYNTDAQRGIEALNWGGRIAQNFDGDYLHINDANFGGQKSNMFIKENVKVEYKVVNGEVSKTITITYKNPQPHSDCDLEHGALCLNATLRNFQRIYVPKGAALVSSRGSEVKVETRDDLGKTTYEAFFTVKPLGKSEITYTYKLPFTLKNDSPLPVLIQKQPGTDAIPYEIFVNGKRVESFNLNTDKQLNLKI